MKIFNFLFAVILLICANTAFGQKSDEDAIRQACFDYIDAFYKADTSLAYRSVHPQLQKRGYFYSAKDSKFSNQLEMPFPALVSLAKTWNANGSRTNAQSPRTVKILDMEDKTAAAKVSAVWGIDYIHLVKLDDKWWVMNVLWQSIPPSLVKN